MRGNYKQREDFKYVFSEIEIQCEQELKDGLLNDVFYILCDENDDLENMQHEIDYLYVKDLLCLLDEEYVESAHKIPSLMFEKTYNAPMVEQRLCIRPFYHAQIDSGMNFKFCCGDWSESVGNILKDTPQTIWESVVAKIFRLSLINKTYCFCYTRACDYLVPNPAPAKERMNPGPIVKQIPDSFEIGIDKTCNLFCKSCRDCVVVEQGERKQLIEKAKENIIASGWLEKIQRTLYGGQGEVFFSKTYRDLIYEQL